MTILNTIVYSSLIAGIAASFFTIEQKMQCLSEFRLISMNHITQAQTNNKPRSRFFTCGTISGFEIDDKTYRAKEQNSNNKISLELNESLNTENN